MRYINLRLTYLLTMYSRKHTAAHHLTAGTSCPQVSATFLAPVARVYLLKLYISISRTPYAIPAWDEFLSVELKKQA